MARSKANKGWSNKAATSQVAAGQVANQVAKKALSKASSKAPRKAASKAEKKEMKKLSVKIRQTTLFRRDRMHIVTDNLGRVYLSINGKICQTFDVELDADQQRLTQQHKTIAQHHWALQHIPTELEQPDQQNVLTSYLHNLWSLLSINGSKPMLRIVRAQPELPTINHCRWWMTQKGLNIGIQIVQTGTGQWRLNVINRGHIELFSTILENPIDALPETKLSPHIQEQDQSKDQAKDQTKKQVEMLDAILHSFDLMVPKVDNWNTPTYSDCNVHAWSILNM